MWNRRRAHLLGYAAALLVLSGCGSDDRAGSVTGKGFQITVSGEDLAVKGYAWDASSTTETPAFVDGWALTFEHVIVTVGRLRLNADPDRDPGDPQNLGATVVAADGPWAVDATIGGDIIGKSQSPDEKTVAIASFATRDDGAAFDSESRYAFSYDLLPASAEAELVNLDDAGKALYQRARAEGWSMVLAGRAEYRGPEPDADSVFARLPRQVKFTLGLSNPSSYVNCRNTDLAEVGGEFPRGIQASPDAPVTAQITVHTDHAFWDTLNVEGTPLHFDPIAAQASNEGDADSSGEVTNEALSGADFTAFTTRDGEPLPARSLVPDYAAPSGQLRYDSNGTSFRHVNDFLSFLSYSAASGGHLNADGECEVVNHFTP